MTMRCNYDIAEYMKDVTAWMSITGYNTFIFRELPAEIRAQGKKKHQKAAYNGYLQKVTTTKDRTVGIWRIIRH